jgi:aminoglycoside phosphotransferase (APT) family kinase protein
VDFTGTRPVAPKLAFDTARLSEHLRRTIDGFPAGPIEVAQFKGGQSNPTYELTAGGRSWVLRRKPPGKLLQSAHAVDREHRVMAALRETGVPVPRVFGYCEDPEVIGTPFFVMEHVAGRVLWDPTLPQASPGERRAIYDEMNRVIAALHGVDPAAVGLSDFGRPGNYFARQIDRWSKQYRASETEPIAAMDRLIDWLPRNLPAAEETAIVHGDFRLDNLIFHPSEPRILAVLDWELSTLGHPLADFSYHCMTWRMPTGVFRGLGGVDLAPLGIPSEAEHVAAYVARTGRPAIDDAEWGFCVAYNMFRLAAILQGIMGRVKDGTAASAEAMLAAQAARPVAELAWQQVERMGR